MPLAIEAVEQYGRDAFVAPTFLENLLQTDATVATVWTANTGGEEDGDAWS
jgi:hypothetical protein